MKRFVFCIFSCIMVFGTTLNTHAQKVEVVDGMTWYLDKEDAIEVAREQNKYVFLLWGRSICERCEKLRADIARCPIQSVIEKDYVLWYSDSDLYDRDHPDVAGYLSSFPSNAIPLPVVCVIDPADATIAYGLQNGDYDVNDLAEMLQSSVNNDYITNFIDVKVGVYKNNLVIRSEIINEYIHVFTVTGSFVDRFRKTEYDTNRNISVYPGGVLVVTGSSGWTRKIFVR